MRTTWCTITMVAAGFSAVALLPQTAYASFPNQSFDFAPSALSMKVTAVSMSDYFAYALAADGNSDHAIYQARIDGLGGWQRQAGLATALGGGTGSSPDAPYMFVSNSSGKSYFSPSSQSYSGWTELLNDTIPVQSIDFGGSGASWDQYGPMGGPNGSYEFMTSTSGLLYTRYLLSNTNGGAGAAWQALSVPGAGALKKVVALGGIAWVTDTLGHIYTGTLIGGSVVVPFHQVPGCARDIAIGASAEPIVIGCGAPIRVYYGQFPSYEWQIYHYVSGSSSFVADNFTGIAVGASKVIQDGVGYVFAINADYDLYVAHY